MAAVAYLQTPRDARPATVRSRRPPTARPLPAAVYRRRRLAAALAAAPVLALVGHALAAGSSPGYAAPMRPAAGHVYVVQPGDTVWGIAHRLDPGGDERPLVDLITAQAGSSLQPGQRLDLP